MGLKSEERKWERVFRSRHREVYDKTNKGCGGRKSWEMTGNETERSLQAKLKVWTGS